MPMLRELTKLPIELAVTHAHIDHIYHADEFSKVYLHKNEIKAWHRSIGLSMMFGYGMFNVKRKSYNVKSFTPIDEDTVIDLGGVKIRVINSPGHTVGSVTFVDENHKSLFLGDAVGSGSVAWLWLPGCYTVSKYKHMLTEFLVKLSPYRDYNFLGGHRMQGILTEHNKNAYPLTMQVVEDMKKLCEKMLTGEIEPQNPSRISIYKLNTYTYKQATMVQRKALIR